jgi:hypothetical protein
MTAKKKFKIADCLKIMELCVIAISAMEDEDLDTTQHEIRYNKMARKLNKILGFDAIINFY